MYYPTDPKSGKNDARAPKYTTKRIDNLDTRIPYMTDVIRHIDELSHKTRSTYAVNALFGDGHVRLCNDAAVFDKDYWALWDKKTDEEKLEGGFYYKIFKLMGEAK
jgi:prepilin-type processing-associated H-X9-DG protein